MNTQDCSACEQHQLTNTAFACPSCGHFTFVASAVDTNYSGSQADHAMQEEDDKQEYFSEAFERASEILEVPDTYANYYN